MAHFRRIILASFVVFGLCVITSAGFAQTAPAQQQTAPKSAWPSARPAVSQPQAAPPETSGWSAWLLGVQQSLQSRLAGTVRDLKTGNVWFAAFALIGFSFLYGVFHAVGPGHGKAVISSYVIANRTTLRRGVILSFASSLVQALSAIGIVVVLAIGVKAAGVEIRETVRYFEIISAVLVILAGCWLLLLQAQRHWLAPRVLAAAGGHAVPIPDAHGHGHDHTHGDNCGCGHAHIPLAKDLQENWSLRHAAAIVLAVGMRPCTGAVFVLIFALTQGMFWAGVGATFAMALGTAITVSALAVLAVGSRETAARFAGSRWADWIYGWAGIASALLVLLFGVLLLLGALSKPAPF